MAHEQSTTGKNKRGGARKMLTWQEKLALAEPDSVRIFVWSADCDCECRCLQRAQQLGEDAVQAIVNLRVARFAGKNLDEITVTSIREFFHSPKKRHPGCKLLASQELASPSVASFPIYPVGEAKYCSMVSSSIIKANRLFLMSHRRTLSGDSMGVRSVQRICMVGKARKKAQISIPFATSWQRLSPLLGFGRWLPAISQQPGRTGRSVHPARKTLAGEGGTRQTVTGSQSVNLLHSVSKGVHLQKQSMFAVPERLLCRFLRAENALHHVLQGQQGHAASKIFYHVQVVDRCAMRRSDRPGDKCALPRGHPQNPGERLPAVQ